jgi:hypothetical protein
MVRSALLTVHPRRDSDATKMLFRNPGGGTAGVEVTATPQTESDCVWPTSFKTRPTKRLSVSATWNRLHGYRIEMCGITILMIYITPTNQHGIEFIDIV